MSDFLFVKCAIVDNLQKQGVYIAWFVHLSGDVYSVYLIKWYMWKLQLTWFVYLYFTCIELLCLIAFAKCPSCVLLQFFFLFHFCIFAFTEGMWTTKVKSETNNLNWYWKNYIVDTSDWIYYRLLKFRFL